MKEEKTKKDQRGFGFTPNKKDAEPAKEKKPPQEQKNLFGDKDQIYNTIQAEISIIVAGIGSCYDSIEKQKEKVVIFQRRKDNLERAARSVAKMRDEELSKKKAEKKEKGEK